MWPVTLAQVLPRPQLIFPFKTWFLEFIWILSCRCHFKINISRILNPNLTKLNPAHQALSNHTKGTFQFLGNFQLQFNLIFNKEIIQYSRTFAPQVQTSWNQADGPILVLVESFPKTSRTWSEASQFKGSHNYKTKQTTFLIDRIVWPVPLAQV